MESDGVIPTSQLRISFGSLFISIMLGSALWGAAGLQLYYYCEKYWRTDPKHLKAFVILLWLSDTIHQGLLIEISYVYFVNGMTDPTLLTVLPKEIGINGFLIGLIDSTIQCFYLRRVWYLSNRNWKLTVSLLIPVLAQLVLTLVYCVRLVQMTLIRELSSLAHYEIIMNCSAVLSDVPLAISMIWLLKRNRSGITRTDSIVNRLVRLTIGSGLATALWAVIAAIGATASPHSIICLSADLIFPKLYFNCMMASFVLQSSVLKDLSDRNNSLNARSGLRQSLHAEVVGVSIGFGHVGHVASSSAGRSNVMTDVPPKEMTEGALECQIEVDFESVRDEGVT